MFFGSQLRSLYAGSRDTPAVAESVCTTWRGAIDWHSRAGSAEVACACPAVPTMAADITTIISALLTERGIRTA